MPLYEYRCTSCGYNFEKIQNYSAKPETECPKCQGVLIRPVTAPALRFEGAGWYVNDYAGKGGSKTEPKSGDAVSTEGSSAADKEAKSASADSTSATPKPASNSAPSAPAASSAPSTSSSSTPASTS